MVYTYCIFQITIPSEERRDDEKLYHKITIGDLQKKAPAVNTSLFYIRTGYILIKIIDGV